MATKETKRPTANRWQVKIHELENSIKTLKSDVTKLNAENTDLVDTLNKLSEENSDLKNETLEHESVRTSLNKLKEKYAITSGELSQLQGEHCRLLQEFAELQARYDRDLSELNQEIARLTLYSNTLKNSIESGAFLHSQVNKDTQTENPETLDPPAPPVRRARCTTRRLSKRF